MLCPKQLRWVRNPTQTCHAVQLQYLQYSNDAYHNRQLYCLRRLGKLTGERLFSDLFERIMQGSLELSTSHIFDPCLLARQVNESC
jgi:hypothetical protein